MQRTVSQRVPIGQARPQAPQWSGSRAMSTQRRCVPASGSSTSHSARPRAQVGEHVPREQTAPSRQRRSQAPQLDGSRRIAAQVSPSTALQSASRSRHVGTQRRFWQRSPAAHRWPQAPQLAGSEAVTTQRPSQRDWPGPQASRAETRRGIPPTVPRPVSQPAQRSHARSAKTGASAEADGDTTADAMPVAAGMRENPCGAPMPPCGAGVP